MTIHLDLSYEEAQIIRTGLNYAIMHAQASARAMKNNPLEVYRNKEVEEQYRAVEKRIAAAVNAKIKKFVDAKNKGVV